MSAFDFQIEPFEFDYEMEEEWETGSPNRSSRDYIRWVQQSLNQIMGLKLATDGDLGPKTRSAIRSFQQKQGLTADGILGAQTEAAIKAALGAGTPASNCEVVDDFEFDKDAIRPIQQTRLIEIARRIVASQDTSQPVRSIQLIGHTDPAGTAAYNLDLGRRRADQVRVRLGQLIDQVRRGLAQQITFRVDSRGETQPIASDAARNRRVEVCLQAQSRPDGPVKPGVKPQPPLSVEEIPLQLKPRPALKSAAALSIELPLILPAGAQLRVEAISERARISASERPGSFTTATKLTVPGVLGKRTLPPSIPIKVLEPSSNIKALQAQARSLAGRVPDHLPFLPLPASLPDALASKPRIQVQLPANRPKDLHEPTTVFRPDERKVFHDTAFPWCAVGRVETPAGVCSGVMVGPRHMLTCSHGINWLNNGTAGYVKFTPAYFDAGTVPPFGFAYAITIYSLQKVDASDGIDRSEGQYDYVVVVLGSRLGDLTGWMGVQSWSDSWDKKPYWWHIGYPGDLTSTERPTFQKGIALDGSFWDREVHTRIWHKGDVWPGQSGGPYFAWWKGELAPRVVAVQSGQNSGENSASGGADMVELVIKAQRAHP